jgi:hypothetical protein
LHVSQIAQLVVAHRQGVLCLQAQRKRSLQTLTSLAPAVLTAHGVLLQRWPQCETLLTVHRTAPSIVAKVISLATAAAYLGTPCSTVGLEVLDGLLIPSRCIAWPFQLLQRVTLLHRKAQAMYHHEQPHSCRLQLYNALWQ